MAANATILVIEDDPSSIGAVTALLQDQGYRVAVSRDGESGLARAAHIRPDLILLDVMMPGLDGFETCRRLKADERTRDVPVLFLTVVADARDAVQGFAAGAVDYITKPFRSAEVLARVRTHLALRELQLNLEAQVLERTKALRKSEAQFRTITESSADAIFISDHQGNYTYVNSAACALLGYDSTELTARNITDISAPDAIESNLAAFQSLVKEGRLVMELELVRKDGSHVPVDLNAVVLPNDLVYASCRDITERRQAEKALRYSNELYTATYAHSPTAMVLVDVETRTLLSINEAYTRLTGYREQEVVGIPGKAGFLIKAGAAKERLFAAGAIGQSLDGEQITWTTKHTGERDILVYGSQLNLRGKNLYLVTMADVTELRRAEEQYRVFFRENIGNAFWLEMKNPVSVDLPVEDQVDAMFREAFIKDCNDECAGYYGFARREEVLGKSLPHMWAPAATQRDHFTHQYFQSFAQSGHHLYGTEVPGATQAGEEKWFLNNLHGIVSDGHLLRIWGSQVDITERKRAELELQAAFSEIQALKDQLEAENVYLRKEVEQASVHGPIVAESGAMKKVLALAEQVAPTDATVLVLGETGTGKELLAQAIHTMSSRKDRALVVVNCAAIPATLVEGELFGREKGAYTGAVTKQLGRFEIADGSTLFLDEVGELGADAQAKLLRVLQEGEFERLGDTKTTKVDVRVVAATNRDLDKEVAAGRFRSDLYYRLNVFPVEIPPLRDRREDIAPLVWRFVTELNERMGRRRRVESIPQKELDAISAYAWPGNVRELRNVVERAMILCTGTTLHLDVPPGARPAAAAPSELTLAAMEKRHILEVLERTGWRVRGDQGAAHSLGIKPTTLESRMRKLGIVRPSSRPS